MDHAHHHAHHHQRRSFSLHFLDLDSKSMAELQLPLSQATGGDSTSSTIYDAEFPTVGENRLSRPKRAALAVLSTLGLAALAGGGYWLAKADAPAPVTTISLSYKPGIVPKNSKALASAKRQMGGQQEGAHLPLGKGVARGKGRER